MTETTPKQTGASPKQQSLWRLLALLRPKHRKYIVGLSARVVLTTIERLYIAYLLKLLTDAIVGSNKTQFVSVLVTLIIFYAVLTAVAPFVLYLWRSAVVEGTANIRETIFKHIQRLPLGYHELHHSGDALSILTNDAAAAERAYQEDFYTLVEVIVQGVGAAILMFYVKWELALVIILCGLAPLAINSLFAGPLRRVGQAVQARLGGGQRAHDRPAGGFPGGAHLRPGQLDPGPLQPGQPTGAGELAAARAPGIGPGGRQ